MRGICNSLSLTLLLVLLTSCGKAPTVKTAGVTRGTVEAVVTSVTSGTVRAEQQAELAFGAVGRVQSLSVALGDSVKAGQVLSELENKDLRTTVWFTERELKRRQELHARNSVSATELEETQRQHEAAVSALEKSVIRAPFDGIVTELNLEVGQLSQITAVIPKPLIRLIDTQPRYVRASIDEVDLGKVAVNMPARIKVPAIRREPFAATVVRMVPYVSTIKEQDRTAEIDLRVEPSEILLPVGASADVEIITERRDNVLAATSRAVLGRQGDRYVYRLDGSKARRVKVTVGISDYEHTEILSGLSENDKLIIPSDEVELSDGLSVSVAE